MVLASNTSSISLTRIAAATQRPELVVGPLPHRDDPGSSDPRRFGADLRAEHAGSWQAIDGYGDSPDLASAELGRRWLDVAADAVADAYAAFQRASGGPIG